MSSLTLLFSFPISPPLSFSPSFLPFSLPRTQPRKTSIPRVCFQAGRTPVKISSGSRGLWFFPTPLSILISENSASGHRTYTWNLHQFLQETFIPNMLLRHLPHPSFICRLTGYSVRIFPPCHTLCWVLRIPGWWVGFPVLSRQRSGRGD